MKVTTSALVAGLALLAAGCGGGAKSTTTIDRTVPPPTTTSDAAAAGRCTSGPAELVARIRSEVILDGARFHRPSVVVSRDLRGVEFLSVRVTGGGVTGDEVATWLLETRNGKQRIYALDAVAAVISQYGASTTANPSYVVQLPGVYRSRVCAGGHGVSRGVTAPPSGRGGATG